MAGTQRAAREPAGLDLPSLYTPVSLRGSKDAFAEACRRAGTGEAETGSLFFVRRPDVLEFAVVLAPEEPLATARRAVFAGLNALADALAVAAPPEKPIAFVYPATLLMDGARLGGARLGWPKKAAEDAVPDWLVFAAMLWIDKSAAGEPGLTPGSTDLIEEGFENPDAGALVESFARHLMSWFDTWAERGFRPVGEGYLSRLPKAEKGERRGIDANGDLLVHGKADGPAAREPLVPALQRADWFDPQTRMPRL
jgi:hypothetical protein